MWVQGPVAPPSLSCPMCGQWVLSPLRPGQGQNCLLCDPSPSASPGSASVQLDHSSGLWLGGTGQLGEASLIRLKDAVASDAGGIFMDHQAATQGISVCLSLGPVTTERGLMGSPRNSRYRAKVGCSLPSLNPSPDRWGTDVAFHLGLLLGTVR